MCGWLDQIWCFTNENNKGSDQTARMCRRGLRLCCSQLPAPSEDRFSGVFDFGYE